MRVREVLAGIALAAGGMGLFYGSMWLAVHLG